MTNYYVGTGGADVNSGLSWANRKLTLTGAESNGGTHLAPGDIVYAGAGVYRETLTALVSGANTYSTGTLSLTNGSTTVTGSGTSWLANVAANYVLHIAQLAHGTDGVTVVSGNTFTSAAGNFQASMIGKTIRINTVGAYYIVGVSAANSITVRNADGTAPTFSALTGLTYDVGPEEPYTITSVSDNTTIVLNSPWLGPTITGVSYLTYNPIRFVGDVTGVYTDGVGGIVRVTGSDNDTTATRANCISLTTPIHYRHFRGLQFDMTTSYLIDASNALRWLVEDCVFSDSAQRGIGTNNASFGTIRRNTFMGGRPNTYNSIYFTSASTIDNIGMLISNNLFMGTSGIAVSKMGGFSVRNNTFYSGNRAIQITAALTVGQTITVNNNLFIGAMTTAMQATAANEILEDYNNFYGNNSDRNTVSIGQHSLAYPPLFNPFPLFSGVRSPQLTFADLSQWSALRALAGLNMGADDMYGAIRPVTDSKKSWGAIQYNGSARLATQAQSGSYSLCLPDAGRVQFTIPVKAVSTTFKIYVYREANYAGTNPQMVIKQPGQADVTVLDAGAAAGWNLLTTTLTPASMPGYVVVEIVSNNTATSGSYNTYFDGLAVN